MIIIIKILEALLRTFVTSITEFRDLSLGHIHFHNSRDENEVDRRQSRSLLAKWKKSAISNTGAALSSTGITPHLAARDRAMQLVKKDNPTLSPTINRTWIESWGRAEVMAIYRIHPSFMGGRTMQGISSR
jgi:hypothetical protein